MEELKKCPFCGEKSLLRERWVAGVANAKHYRYECHECKSTFANWYRSVKKAAAAWNRRAGWVKCSERLPEEYGTYLVWLGGMDAMVNGKRVYTAWWYSGSKYWSFSMNTALETGRKCSTDVRSVEVTHWMPLPEPPESEVPND